jgi:hypothetical protein
MTIIKLKQMFKDIADKHEMINDYGFGPSYEIGADKPMKYTFVWAELIDSSLLMGEPGNGLLTQQYRFYLYCLDKVIKGDDNYLDTTSKCDYILKTFIAQLDQNETYIEMGMRIDGDVLFEPVYEQTEDIANGFQATLTLRMPMRYNPCNSPIN